MAKFPVMGLLITRYKYELIRVQYLADGYYGAFQVAQFEAPVMQSAKFGSQLATFVTWMLR